MIDISTNVPLYDVFSFLTFVVFFVVFLVVVLLVFVSVVFFGSSLGFGFSFTMTFIVLVTLFPELSATV